MISSLRYIMILVVMDLFKIHRKMHTKKDPSIRQSDVKEWFENNIKKKTNVKGHNSFVAPHAYYEIQIDVFFITHLTNQDYTIGMICIDISK